MDEAKQYRISIERELRWIGIWREEAESAYWEGNVLRVLDLGHDIERGASNMAYAAMKLADMKGA